MIRILCLALAVILPFTVAHAQEDKEEQTPRSTKVFATIVKKQTFSDQLEALGTLNANESVNLTANITDTVSSISFEDGERVTQGTVLATMTNVEEQAMLDEAESILQEAENQLKRIEPLVKQGAAAQSLLDERQRDFQNAEAQVKAMQSRFQDSLIIAPFDGIVGLRNISVGALVQPGTMIATLDDDSVMKLDFTVPSVFLSELKVGDPIKATARAYSDKVFEGTVSSIGARIDPISRSFTVRALIKNPNQILRPGLLMSVTLFQNERETIIIPEEALIMEGNDKFVYVINDESKAAKTIVETGSRIPGVVEIIKGLSEGQKIITDGIVKISDGAMVEVTAIDEGNEPLENMLKKTQESESSTMEQSGS